ncbi:hypothetical protein FRB94_000702 [Tulasnella sp. JGI-2019a]|nr:hypothetical protein FRB94_000702 [Tulasnella sp. JGI-2019a]
MTYIGKAGNCSTLEGGYLTSNILKHKNLTFITGAHVTRLYFDTEDGLKCVTAVEWADKQSPKAKLYCIKVGKGAILFTGAIHTPQLLLISSVSPSEELAKLKVPVKLNLPGVGKDLCDHPIAKLIHKVKPAAGSIEFIKPGTGIVNLWKASVGLIKWLLTKSGPLSSTHSEAAAFF